MGWLELEELEDRELARNVYERSQMAADAQAAFLAVSALPRPIDPDVPMPETVSGAGVDWESLSV